MYVSVSVLFNSKKRVPLDIPCCNLALIFQPYTLFLCIMYHYTEANFLSTSPEASWKPLSLRYSASSPRRVTSFSAFLHSPYLAVPASSSPLQTGHRWPLDTCCPQSKALKILSTPKCSLWAAVLLIASTFTWVKAAVGCLMLRPNCCTAVSFI